MNGVESIKPYYTENPNYRVALHRKRNLQRKKEMEKVNKPKDIPDIQQKTPHVFLFGNEELEFLFILC